MPRYLTATKLGLLILIDVYNTTDLAPAARHEILNFLAFRIVIRSDFDGSSLNERFDFSTTADIAIFGETLSRLSTNVPGRTVHDLFLAKIWALRGLDALVDFVKEISGNVGSSSPPTIDEQEGHLPKISRASPLGQFIRRCNIEFTRLQFPDAQALWSSLAAFRSSSHSSWAARNPEAAQRLQEAELTWTPAPQTQTSTEDTSLLLTFSIHHLQKLGHRLPPGLKANLNAFLEYNVDSTSQSLQHFLAFFEHWRAGQYTMALESLHRYYDYSIASHGPGGIGREGGKDANGGGGPGGGTRVYYQYALLHLSVLHADFERWEASVAAMEECVATAREFQDTPCLLLALSWLLYLRQAHSNSRTNTTSDISTSFGNLAISSSTQADEIAFLKTKARELKYWSLLSGTLLDEGRAELATGTNTPKAVEHLLQAQHLNTTHDLRTQQPATLLFQAAALERLGQTTLSHQIYGSVPVLHSTHIPLPERVRAGCRLALSFERRGEFSQAIGTLDELEEFLEHQATLKSRQRVMGWRMVVNMRRELRRFNIPLATRYHESLTPFLSLSSEPDLSFEIFVLGIELQLKKSQRAEALNKINERIRLLKQNPSTGKLPFTHYSVPLPTSPCLSPTNPQSRTDMTQTLQLLLLKARTFAPSPTSPPTSTSSANTTAPKAFSLALRTAATAQRLHLVPLLCDAVEVLGSILNVLGEYGAAAGLLGGVLPLALESHDLPLTADLYATLTDSLIGLAFAPQTTTAAAAGPHTYSPPSTRTKPSPSTLAQAETMLDLAHGTYTRLAEHQGQLNCLAKKQILAEWRGDTIGAEKATGMSVQLLDERERERREEKGGM